MTVVVRQMLVKLSQVERAFDTTQELIRRNVFVVIEGVEQPGLATDHIPILHIRRRVNVGG